MKPNLSSDCNIKGVGLLEVSTHTDSLREHILQVIYIYRKISILEMRHLVEERSYLTDIDILN